MEQASGGILGEKSPGGIRQLKSPTFQALYTLKAKSQRSK